jgi:excisionase family DNA binding protein
MSSGSHVSYGSNSSHQIKSTADPETHDLLTVEQAAQYLQLSTSSIRWDIRQGTPKAFRIAGLRKVLIPRAELLMLLEPTNFSDGKTPAPKLG